MCYNMGMDYERQKRNRMVKVVITEVIMAAMIAGLLAVLMLVVSGYRINEDLSLEQSGLVQINSLPTGATIEIDGEKISAKTNASRLLKEGKHTVRLSKNGYDSWEKQIKITPGWLLRLRHARLFKDNRQAETVQAMEGLEFISVAPTRNKVLYAKDHSTTWQLITLRGDVITESSLELASTLKVETSEAEVPTLPGQLGELKWSKNGQRLLASLIIDGSTTWFLIDTTNSANHINLTAEFGLNITEVQFSNESGDRLLVLENTNLREINLGAKEISKVFLTDMAEFYALGNDIIYITLPDAEGVQEIGFYHTGEQDSIILRDFAQATAHVAIIEYLNEHYIIYTINDKLFVHKGDSFPTADNGLKGLKQIIDGKSIFIPTDKFSVSKNNEFIIAPGPENNLLVFDAETDQVHLYQAPSNRLQFLDDYILVDVVDSQLTIWDFDGTNQRTIATAANYPAFISENNHYLYYITVEDELLVMKRERL